MGGDAPESGFEALVQAMKCNQIGWREKARRIVLLATDDYPHLVDITQDIKSVENVCIMSHFFLPCNYRLVMERLVYLHGLKNLNFKK